MFEKPITHFYLQWLYHAHIKIKQDGLPPMKNSGSLRPAVFILLSNDMGFGNFLQMWEAKSRIWTVAIVLCENKS